MPQFNDFAKLTTHKLSEKTTFFHPEYRLEVVHTDSSALCVFTDFHFKNPECTTTDTLLTTAHEQMIHNNVKALLVLDEQRHVLGILSSRDILGARRITVAHAQDIHPSEMSVGMLMHKLKDLILLDYKDLLNARVGHIARLLHDHNLQHILVFEQQDTKQIIRGIFSASRISRQLGVDVGIDMGSDNAAQINRDLH